MTKKFEGALIREGALISGGALIKIWSLRGGANPREGANLRALNRINTVYHDFNMTAVRK